MSIASSTLYFVVRSRISQPEEEPQQEGDNLLKTRAGTRDIISVE